jgi:hypothetical protein
VAHELVHDLDVNVEGRPSSCMRDELAALRRDLTDVALELRRLRSSG